MLEGTNMIDFTFGEGILFAWGAIATAFAVYYQHINHMQNRMVVHMLEDPEVFAKVSQGYSEWKEKQGI